jgi:tetratricopeptide (TPR) repeat protein
MAVTLLLFADNIISDNGMANYPDLWHKQAIAQVQPIAQTPQQRLEQGRNLYESGQFSQAVTLWSQAARDYQRLGQVFNQALTLNYLSSAYQELGEWSAAETAINTSMTLLQSQENLGQRGLAIFAQTLNNKGSLQLAQGQTEAALATWAKRKQLTSKLAIKWGNWVAKLIKPKLCNH